MLPAMTWGGRVRRLVGRRELDHRAVVGGLWDQMGEKQFEYLVEQGLRPDHHFLDVGCGSLRGGIHFVRYLDPGHYHGLDIQQPLLDAGRKELEAAGLDPDSARLLQDDAFRFERFGQQFDFALAQSVFTHLPLNTIMRCLAEIERILQPGGRFYATFFEHPGPRLNTEPLRQSETVTTHSDADPFHYDPDVFRWAVEGSSLDVELVGDWNHPRNQQMLRFSKR
jgi:ubiquinone/menaquinone biosynthesis C-methylase UbiE